MPAHVLANAATLDPATFTDWGDVTQPIGAPVSHTSGLLLFRNEDKSSEMGLWECTPGRWRCEVELFGEYKVDTRTVNSYIHGSGGCHATSSCTCSPAVRSIRRTTAR